MSQNDFTLANQSFPAFRADLNSALQALASNNSGTSAPSTTFANMWWYDSANNILYIRNEDNDAWIQFATLDQTNDLFVVTSSIDVGDNVKALFGDSDDLQIYHDGTDSVIKDTGTGNLVVTSNGGGIFFRNNDETETYANFNNNGSVQLRYDNGAKLETTSTGIQVTGNIANASGDLTLDVAGEIVLDADGGNVIFSDAGTTFGRITNTSSDLAIKSDISDKDIIFKGNDGGSVITALTIDMSAGGNVLIGTTDNNPAVSNIIGTAIRNDGEMEISASAKVLDINTQTDGDIAVFRKNGTSVGSIGVNSNDQFYMSRSTGEQGFKFKNSGLIPANTNGSDSDNDQDLGISSVRWKDLYLSGKLTNNGTGGINIDTSGNVGINTNSPASLLHIKSSTVDARLQLTNSASADDTTNSGASFQLFNDDLYINAVENSGNIILRTDGGTGGFVERMRIDANGHVTMPNQSAFQVNPASNQLNMAHGDTIVFGQEKFDQNSDFSSNTFTAPVTGKYQLQLTARVDQLDRDANWVRIEMVTSNRTYEANIIDPDAFDKDPDQWSFNFSVLADMDANDTVFLRWGQSGGVATADFDTQAHFSGFLVC